MTPSKKGVFHAIKQQFMSITYKSQRSFVILHSYAIDIFFSLFCRDQHNAGVREEQILHHRHPLGLYPRVSTRVSRNSYS